MSGVPTPLHRHRDLSSIATARNVSAMGLALGTLDAVPEHSTTQCFRNKPQALRATRGGGIRRPGALAAPASVRRSLGLGLRRGTGLRGKPKLRKKILTSTRRVRQHACVVTKASLRQQDFTEELGTGACALHCIFQINHLDGTSLTTGEGYTIANALC